MLQSICYSVTLTISKACCLSSLDLLLCHHRQINKKSNITFRIAKSFIAPSRANRKTPTLKIFHFPWAKMQPNWFCENWYRLHTILRARVDWCRMCRIPKFPENLQRLSDARASRVSDIRLSAGRPSSPLVHPEIQPSSVVLYLQHIRRNC